MAFREHFLKYSYLQPQWLPSLPVGKGLVGIFRARCVSADCFSLFFLPHSLLVQMDEKKSCKNEKQYCVEAEGIRLLGWSV